MCLIVQWNPVKGRVALEPILFTSNFWRAKNCSKFGGGRIGRTFFNQNFADRHIRHKIYRQQSLSRVNCAIDFVREFKISLRCVFLTLRSPATIRSAYWRLCCCLHYLRSKKIVLLKPSLQIVASNQIKETSHKNLYKNGAQISRFHSNNCEDRQIERVKK